MCSLSCVFITVLFKLIILSKSVFILETFCIFSASSSVSSRLVELSGQSVEIKGTKHHQEHVLKKYRLNTYQIKTTTTIKHD